MDLFTSGIRRFERVSVLESDPELGARLAPDRRRRAEHESVARVLRRPAGVWHAEQDADHGRDGYGLLVLEGMLIRRVGLEPRYGTELLSVGDILQPAEHDGEGAVLPFTAAWHVLQPLKLAILDFEWVIRMAPHPEVSVALLRRAARRSRRLASALAIIHHHRLEDRLWLFFWELADRFGRVRPEGVVVDLELTHELIGHLVGARRPSVSTALMRLERDKRLRRAQRSWILLGDPPGREEMFTAPPDSETDA